MQWSLGEWNTFGCMMILNQTNWSFKVTRKIEGFHVVPNCSMVCPSMGTRYKWSFCNLIKKCGVLYIDNIGLSTFNKLLSWLMLPGKSHPGFICEKKIERRLPLQSPCCNAGLQGREEWIDGDITCLLCLAETWCTKGTRTSVGTLKAPAKNEKNIEKI